MGERRILVVDDDPQIRAMLGELLRESGHVAVEAADGVSAYREVQSDTPDLIITDIVMPQKAGLEMILEIREEYPNLPIIAMSGGGAANQFTYLGMAKRLGVAAVFAKPFNLELLMRTVEALLDHHAP